MSREDQILQVAQRLFFERGFEAVGVDEIGETAGITGPAIYRHFSGKDEILGTLFDRAVDALLLRAREQHEDPIEELQFLARTHAEFVVQHQELASILIRDDRSLAAPYNRRHRRRERPYIERWTDCLERLFPARSREELTSATFAILQLMNSPGTWPRAARRTENLGDLLAELALGAAFALGEPARVDGDKPRARARSDARAS